MVLVTWLFIGFVFRVYMTRSILTRRGWTNHPKLLTYHFLICWFFLMLFCRHCLPRRPGGMMMEFFSAREIVLPPPPQLWTIGSFTRQRKNKNRNRKCERMSPVCNDDCHFFFHVILQQWRFIWSIGNSMAKVGRSLGGSVSSACVFSARHSWLDPYSSKGTQPFYNLNLIEFMHVTIKLCRNKIKISCSFG